MFVPLQRVGGHQHHDIGEEVPLQIEHDRHATANNFRVNALPAISSALSSGPQRTMRAQAALSRSLCCLPSATRYPTAALEALHQLCIRAGLDAGSTEIAEASTLVAGTIRADPAEARCPVSNYCRRLKK